MKDTTTNEKNGNLAKLGDLIKTPEQLQQLTQHKANLEPNEHSFATAYEAALAPPRGYTRKSEWKAPEVRNARFKIQIRFLDGGRAVKPSLERKGAKDNVMLIDEEEGLMKLIRLVREKWPAEFQSAHIYMARADHPKVKDHCHDMKVVSIYPDGNVHYYNFDFETVDYEKKGRHYVWRRVDWLTLVKLRD